MITIPNYKISQASSVYGDYGVQKVAFTLNVNPADVMGSIAGGYAATSVYNKKKDAQLEKSMKKQNIENGSYSQIQSLLQNLKIVFTPINVIYSVNGQVFDIVQAMEMNPYMKQAFLKKDADYFRNLLMNKINMELQLAEQAFSQRLLTAGGYGEQVKESSYAEKQECFIKIAEEQFDSMVKTASVGLDDKVLQIDPSFDCLRPFSKSEIFFKPNEFTKVAGIFDMFDQKNDTEDVSIHRLNNEVNIGFLPDRVVFLWNGQLVEQMSILQMNESGYQAFLKKDKEFFINLFKQHTIQTDKILRQPQSPEPEANMTPKMENDPFPKEAASLEDIVDDIQQEYFPVIERLSINPFADPDIHPIAYDAILTKQYGNWANHEFEALIKQIEVDFKLTDGVHEIPLTKLGLLHAVSNSEHSMFLAPFTFEKFIRGMNSKTVLFENFQGNISFEELLFGIEIAKSYCGEEVFWQFHENIAPYVSEELMNNQIRFVSSQVYDETNPSEKDFFDAVNGYLSRKWREVDAQRIIDADKLDLHHSLTHIIIEATDHILKNRAEEINIEDPYQSVEHIIESNDYLDSVDEEFKLPIKNMVKGNIVATLMSALFLEYKHRELEYTIQKLKEEGVIRG
jgi:hypothetical protein